MVLRIVLIEDEDRVQLRARIEGLGDLEVKTLPPPSNLDLSEMLQSDADLFLIDYELDTAQSDGSIANYRGMTLAARLREKTPEYPIVLLTRPEITSWSFAQRTVRAGGTFDSILYKVQDVVESPNTTLNRLVSLAHGYTMLRDSKDRSSSSLLNLLQTDESGHENALRATPPGGGWAAVEAANWIRLVLLRYPGVLYDSRHAATALGISIDSFEKPPVLELLGDAEYHGPFAGEKRRWWRHSLFDVALRVCGDREKGQGLREGFRVAGSELLGFQLEPSKDRQTGRVPADTVCHVLGIPVRIETSLPYRPDVRPSVMDEARVSFKAIQETNCVDENFLDTQSRALLEEIRRQPHGD